VAQLGARFHGMEEVIGSIPIRSTNKSNKIKYLQFYIGALSDVKLKLATKLLPRGFCKRSFQRS
jgi:hypothetical protein